MPCLDSKSMPELTAIWIPEAETKSSSMLRCRPIGLAKYFNYPGAKNFIRSGLSSNF